MKKRVLVIFVVILMILHMVPVYAAAIEGSAERLDAPLIQTTSTTILLTMSGGYFKIIPTESTTYTIGTIGSADSWANLQDANGNSLAYADDENGWDFELNYLLLAGQTYYLFVRDLGMQIECTLNITGGGLLVPDTTPPASPVISSISADTGASSFDGITKDTTLLINGTGEANSTVEIYKNSVPIGITTTNASGSWTFDYRAVPLADGIYHMTARATDAAGNPSILSIPFIVIIDTTPPAPPVITSISDDTGVDSSDKITNDNTLTFSGTAEAGSYVEIFNNDTYDWWGTSQADGNGNWSVNNTNYGLTSGDYNVIARATDLAGNQSGLSDIFTFSIDKDVPNISALSPIDNATNVGVNDNLIITFSENVYVGSGNISIYQKSDNALFESIPVTGSKVTGSGTNMITINPSSSFSSRTQYYVQVDATAFTDAAGNAYAGIADLTSWDFTAETVEHLVTFVDHDGAPLKEEMVEDGYAATAPTNLTREGHTFAGWDTDFSNVTEDLMVTAQWTINQYTITFDNNDGSSVPAITQDYGTAITAPADPTKEGHTFAGWDTFIPSTMPAQNKTITARWDVNQYTITFDTTGGSSIGEITQDYGTAITTPVDPAKEGHTFTGWDTFIPSTMPAQDMTITAQWDVNQYTITFDTDGGSTVPAITQDYGTAITAPANPTRTGFTFAGWDTAVPGTMPAGNMTITASWDANQYTINFDTDGGSSVTMITQDYGTVISAPTDPTKVGYAFIGWNIAVPATMPDQNMVITAQWDVNQYTITYDTDGGSDVASITQDYGTAVSALANPTKAGYTFVGWNTAVPSTMPAQDMTITAQWELTAVQRVINSILGLPDSDEVELIDGEEIKLVSRLYNDLSDSEKQEIPSDLVSSLNLVGTTFAELNMVDNTSGLSLKASDGTVLDPNLELVVEEVDETSDHNMIIEQTFGGKKLLQVFDISLMLNGQTVQPSGTIRVSIPIPAELLDGFENHQIVFISEDGTATVIPSTVEGNMIWFETDHLSDYGIIADAVNSETDTDKGSIPKTGETSVLFNLEFFVFSTSIILLVLLLMIRRKIVKGER